MDESETSNRLDPLALQRQYWDTWVELTNQALGAAASGEPRAPGLGADGLFKWWEAVSNTAPPTTHDFLERLLAISQSYFEIGERFAGSPTQDSAGILNQWLDNLHKAYRSVIEGTAPPPAPGGRGHAFWDLPLDTWHRTFSAMLPIPGDYLHATKDAGVARVTAAEVRDQLDRVLAVPAVGYSREAQDQHQRLLRLILDYFETLEEYSVGFARVGIRSIEHFRKKIDDVAAPVDALRTLYDLWVEAFEEVYSEYVMSPEYSALYGRMVNALVAVKHQGSQLVDEVLESMNMPTRREVNTLHQRLHELRRQNNFLRAEMELVKERLDGAAAARTANPPLAAKSPAGHEQPT